MVNFSGDYTHGAKFMSFEDMLFSPDYPEEVKAAACNYLSVKRYYEENPDKKTEPWNEDDYFQWLKRNTN